MDMVLYAQILKAIELYTLNVWILYHVNYILINSLKNGLCKTT